MSKTSAVPKTVVERGRRALYDLALTELQKDNPDANISGLIRDAMDRRCAHILGITAKELRSRAAAASDWE